MRKVKEPQSRKELILLNFNKSGTNIIVYMAIAKEIVKNI